MSQAHSDTFEISSHGDFFCRYMIVGLDKQLLNKTILKVCILQPQKRLGDYFFFRDSCERAPLETHEIKPRGLEDFTHC